MKPNETLIWSIRVSSIIYCQNFLSIFREGEDGKRDRVSNSGIQIQSFKRLKHVQRYVPMYFYIIYRMPSIAY